ncbi:MAG: hypothetical protein JWO98_4944 [Frankiales bacterium]|nr:hypothetical protein [Frankiales bacterium]
MKNRLKNRIGHVVIAIVAVVIGSRIGWDIGQHGVALSTTCAAAFGTFTGSYFGMAHLYEAWQRAKDTAGADRR